MKVCALDLSLQSTGVARFDGETERWQPRQLRGVDRLSWFDIRLRALLDDDRPDVVVLEGYAFGARGNAVFQIGELGGVVRLALHRRGCNVVVVPPTVLKKFATGKGTADKKTVQTAAEGFAKRPFGSNDEADAWWLWVIGRQLTGQPVLSPRAAAELPSTVQFVGNW